MNTDASAAMAEPEKRASDRIRSFLRAQIIFNNRMTTIDCIIKNISATGARVALNDTLAVPTEFEIYIPQRGCSHHARLVWRDRDSIGIDFTGCAAADARRGSARPAAPEPHGFGGEARLRELEVQNAELKARIRKLTQAARRFGPGPQQRLLSAPAFVKRVRPPAPARSSRAAPCAPQAPYYAWRAARRARSA